METIDLETPEPFNWQECLWYLDRGFKDCLHHIDGLSVKKLLLYNHKPVLFEVEYQGHLRINILHNPGNADSKFIAGYVTDWFDLDCDLRPFLSLAKNDKILSPLTDRYFGLRMVCIVDLFEALAWAIIGQQINLHFAHKLKAALVKNFGHKFKINGNGYFAFPSPDVIASLSINDLLSVQFSKQKADYLVGLAKIFEAGGLIKSDLAKSSYTQIIERLNGIRGIGPWSANYVAMRCLKKSEAFPVHDAGLQNALKNILGLPAKPDIVQIEKLGRAWDPWQAYATLYIWRSLADG